MRNLLIQLFLCLHLLAPTAAFAQTTVKDPLNYPIKQYGFILAVALLGGLVSWYAKVRKGDTTAANLGGLIGELATSAFAGLLAFWGCEYYNLPPLLTAALAGLAGHAGGSGIAWLEALAKRRAEKALDVTVAVEQKP
jgi:hypothetical protein